MREGLRSGESSLRSGKLRKGLRSGELRERPRKGEISTGKDKTLPKLTSVPKDDESCMESTKLDSFPEFKTENMDGSGVGCNSGEGMNECRTNGVLQYRRKRVRDDNGEGYVCLDEERMKKKAKKEISECEVQNAGRVLRSQTRSGSHFKKETEIAESGCTEIDTLGGQNDKLLVKIDNDGANQSVEGLADKFLVKTEDDGANQSVEGFIDKFLAKTEDDGANQSVEGLVEQKEKKKRGRPRKIHSETMIVKNNLDRIKKIGAPRKGKRMLRSKGRLDKGVTFSSPERSTRLKETASSWEILSPDKRDKGENFETGGNLASPQESLEMGNTEDDGANQSVEGFIVKFLAKTEDDGANQSVEGLVEQKEKKKRGRPRKIHSETMIVKNNLDRIKKIGAPRKGKRMLRSKGRLNKGVTFSSPERSTRLKETASSSEILSPDKRDKGENFETGGILASPQESLEMGITEYSVVKPAIKTENSVGEGLTRASQKQLVRNRIIELLLSAGWTIDYRPRNGRDYDDAVYVSVDGKTHWSVTKAYNLLKQRYEEGDRAAYKEGFVFFPIPAQELVILNKVMTKKREGKKTNGSQESKNRADRAVRKKKKGKHSSAMTSSGKLTKRKKKSKSIPSEDDESAMEALCHTPWSFGKRKRRDTKRNKRCTFLVRSSDGQDSESNGYVLYKGKRTTLSWMIDLGVVLEKANVSYMDQGKTEVMIKGSITTDGIDCNCCGKVITISEFESHAGSKLCQPLQNTYLHDGIPLVQCLLDAWKKEEKSLQQKWFYYFDIRGDDTNDDVCGLCGDGGNLVCCDGCPSTFHQRCLDIQKFPPGDWHCLFCCCKFCGMILGNANGREEDDKAASLLLTCGFCKEKYHRSCSDVKNATKDIEGSLSFCGKKCQEIYDNIEMLLGLKHEMEEGFSWTLLNRSDIDVDISSKEITRKVECNCKIAVALSVMDECFLPMPDHRSGINLIHNIMYNCGSNFNRLDFSGFYTVTLEKGEEIIAAATIRIHGNILAEMPFIGTRYIYRRQGMCRRLLNAIESVLCSLDVKKLVIPAVSDLEETWTSAFGFEPLDIETQKTLKRLSLLVFPGVAMLQKRVVRSDDGSDRDKQTHAAEGLFSESVKLDDEGEPAITDKCHFLHQNGSSSDITTENIGFSNFATDECREIVVPSSLSAASTAAEPCGDAAPESENGVQKTDASDKVENVNAAPAVDQNLATSNGAAPPDMRSSGSSKACQDVETVAMSSIEISAGGIKDSATSEDLRNGADFIEVPTALEASHAAETIKAEDNGALSIEPESLSETLSPVEEVADDDEKTSEKVLNRRESIEEEEKHDGCEFEAVARSEETRSHEVTDNCHFLHHQNGSSSDITTDNIGFPNCATDDQSREISVPSSPLATVTAGDAALESENCKRKNDVSDTVGDVNVGDQNLATSDGARSSDGSEGCRDVETVTAASVEFVE